ncbi:MAG: FimB/Mfa2 family fimbrial subunit [Muribaculaceae bacterium]|nr:FimB/Mfa2 family fimbrial subunit [Muribaculaceae bacterium]MCF0214262.1 FimB/Mfa2 family fimbrial subunit [Muribaculaceae bacterium]MCF0214512.1 FimB/Mfa2 family fimbrial subunit [Muribaculaceae bacterium]
MTKKLLLGMLAAVGLLATSCSSDDLVNPTVDGDYVIANFTLDTPTGILSRAIGDGTTVDNVACAVFDADGNELTDLRKDDVVISGKTATYSVNLVKGQAYRVVFFAYNKAAEAYDFSDMKNIEVKDAQKSNLEGRDAFTAYTDITVEESKSTIERTIPLYRPFAQLNIGTDDKDAAEKAGIVVETTSVKVTNVYTTFNAYEDKVPEGATTSTVTFAANAIPTETLKVKVNGEEKEYTYLALNYLLVGDKDAEKALTDVEFIVKPVSGNETTATFSNVPVQRNYRTNIVGSLLTNPAQFNIIIDANFEKDDYISWRDVYVKEPKNDGTTYEITSMYELNWIAMQNRGEGPSVSRAAGTPNTFAGKTVKLMNDIDCGGNFIQPMGDNTVDVFPGHSFAGTFDGQGFTIKNFKVETSEPINAAAGLFGTLTGTVKNVNVDNAVINSTHYAGGIVGYANSGATIENCKVTNSTITSVAEWTGSEYDNGDKVGGIVGYISGSVLNNTVGGNTKIQGYRDLGGIAGCASGTITGNKVESNQVVVTVDASHNYKNYTKKAQYNAGHIVGRVIDGSTVENNTGECTLIIPEDTATAKTAAELKALLTTFAGAGAGDNTVNIEEDIVLAEGETWTPITVDGYHGAGKITLNGNGHYIKGLDAPLFNGGFAGSSGIIINNLTIKDCEMTAPSNGAQGFGTFIKNIDSMPYIELNGCVADNITITAATGNDDRIGGLIGWSAGWNGGGEVKTYIYVKNCKVSNCNISANGSLGGIIGHAGGNPYTYHFFTNTVVENCTFFAKASSWRVGAFVGTANIGEITITGCTDKNNTISMTKGDGTPIAAPEGEYTHLYGRLAYGDTGKMTIDGVEIK